MKKLLSILMLTAILAFTSCQEENTFGGSGKEVAVNFSATMPSASLSRASGDGGIVNWVDGTKLRYTLQVFEGTELVTTIGGGSGRVVILKGKNESPKSVAFNGIRLLSNKTYNFVVWADFVKEDGTELHYSTVAGVTNITQIGTRAGNTESRDAYFGMKEIEVKAETSETMVLKRPFGKMRVITTDLKDIHVPFNENTPVKVKYNSIVPTAFNALSGETIGTDVIPAEYTGKMSEITAGNATLSFDYIFASKNPMQTGINFEIECLGASYKFESNFVNIERNKLTTVKGNILTKATNINVSIEDAFETPALDLEVKEVAKPSEITEELKTTGSENNAFVVKDEVKKDDATIVIPNAVMVGTHPSLSFAFPNGVASDAVLKIVDEAPATASNNYNGPVYINIAAGTEIIINLPASTVYLNGTKVENVGTTTAPNTFVVAKDSEITGTLTVNGGNVKIYGKVAKIKRSSENKTQTTIVWLMNGAAKPVVEGNESEFLFYETEQLFSGGSGTYEDPYLLSTKEDVLSIGALYSAGAYAKIYSAALKMTNDIDMENTPIRNLGVMGFLFDGNGKTLNNVNFTSESTIGAGKNVGLLGGFNGKGNEYIYEAKTAKDLNDPKAYTLNGKKYIIKGGCIRDLTIRGRVYSNIDGAVSPLGCGQNTGYIINVTNHASVEAEGAAYFVAGIISGTRGTGLVLDCKNHGNITAIGTDSRPVGGITAQLYGGGNPSVYPDILKPYTASVNNCVNYGNITANCKDVGGIVGQTHGYGGLKCIANSTNEGTITGATNVGGILGRHSSTGGIMSVTGSTNKGTITATATDGLANAIIGFAEGQMEE